MGAPPVWSGVPDEDLLETGRPLRRGVLPVIVVLAFALLVTVAAVVLTRHHPHPPKLVSAPAAAPSVVLHAWRRPVSDVLGLAGSHQSEAVINNVDSTYTTWLLNLTDRTVRLGSPLVRGPHLLALPGTSVTLSRGLPRHANQPVSRHVVRVPAHGRVTLRLVIWPSCSRHEDNISRVPPGKVDVIVPVDGYRRPAVFTFGLLFSGRPRTHAAVCSSVAAMPPAR